MKISVILLSFFLIISLNSCSEDDNGDGPKTYEEVTIGSQVWMLKNLDVTKYANGDPIPQVTDPTKLADLTTGAWCYWENNSANGEIYGKLYNWFAVNDPRGLAPAGWQVPSDDEWKVLEMHLGMALAEADGSGWRGTDEGGKLKEAGTEHWKEPNEGATNESGFTALPGGRYRKQDGVWHNLHYSGIFWSSTASSSGSAWLRILQGNAADIERKTGLNYDVYSVRCIKD
jgi:uncharacterized protein (TIGR02145 family)